MVVESKEHTSLLLLLLDTALVSPQSTSSPCWHCGVAVYYHYHHHPPSLLQIQPHYKYKGRQGIHKLTFWKKLTCIASPCILRFIHTLETTTKKCTMTTIVCARSYHTHILSLFSTRHCHGEKHLFALYSSTRDL